MWFVAEGAFFLAGGHSLREIPVRVANFFFQKDGERERKSASCVFFLSPLILSFSSPGGDSCV